MKPEHGFSPSPKTEYVTATATWTAEQFHRISEAADLQGIDHGRYIAYATLRLADQELLSHKHQSQEF